MGSTRGFLEYLRVDAPYRPVDERVHDYREYVEPLSDEELKKQAARCMDCGIPFCQSSHGCPVINLIPEWNDFIYRGEWREALIRLELTNNFPEITGRVCPAPCETACTLSINSSPVTIKQIELAIVEYGFSQGWVRPRPPERETGRSVAVIGSGPAGLAAAQQIRRAGHRVTVFERSDTPGGLLRYGIPDFKLEKAVLDRRIDQMLKEGVAFQCDVVIGDDISARYLQRSYDAILLAMGAGEPRDLEVPGRELMGIFPAMEYLYKSNRFVHQGEEIPETFSADGKRVLVIGGGDTGSDCIGTSNRQGAREIMQVEILPQPPEWDSAYNPDWPLWPNILRNTASHLEGCDRLWSVQTEGFTGKDGRVRAAHLSKVVWESLDGSGRPTLRKVEGSEFDVKADLVLLAMGFLHVRHERLLDDLGAGLDSRGNLEINDSYQTTVPGVFAAGDAHTGASLVVRSIFHGRMAAEQVMDFLR
jgi:glutamate synthase (NADPH/NADH) small chain